MANIKIDDLAAYANPASTDVLAIVDVGNDITKKVSIANLFTSVPGNATFAGNVGIGTSNPDFNCHIIGTGTDLLKIQRSGSGARRLQKGYRFDIAAPVGTVREARDVAWTLAPP